jgi:hypothetical protein
LKLLALRAPRGYERADELARREEWHAKVAGEQVALRAFPAAWTSNNEDNALRGLRPGLLHGRAGGARARVRCSLHGLSRVRGAGAADMRRTCACVAMATVCSAVACGVSEPACAGESGVANAGCTPDGATKPRCHLPRRRAAWRKAQEFGRLVGPAATASEVAHRRAASSRVASAGARGAALRWRAAGLLGNGAAAGVASERASCVLGNGENQRTGSRIPTVQLVLRHSPMPRWSSHSR